MMKLATTAIKHVSFVIVVCCVNFVASRPTCAQESFDQVWLEPAPLQRGETAFTPRKLIRMTGAVKVLDDRLLEFEPSGSSDAVRVDASRVVWAEPDLTDPNAKSAMEAYRSEKYRESIPLFLEAISARPPVWRAQWLSMHLWQAAYESGRYPATLELVKQIDARPLAPMILGGLPVHWLTTRMPDEAVSAARATLASSAALDATNLTAASWLLGQPDREQAVAILLAISEQNERPALAKLATALLWQRATPPEVLTESSRWKERLKTFPITLVPGPTLLIGQRLEAAGSQDDALECYLKVTLTPSRPHRVSEVAKQAAADLLRRSDRMEEAARLLGDDSAPSN